MDFFPLTIFLGVLFNFPNSSFPAILSQQVIAVTNLMKFVHIFVMTLNRNTIFGNVWFRRIDYLINFT